MAQFEEASPICRGKNLSWDTVLLFYNNMPRQPMPKAQFHAKVESKINGWTTTHSQIARQLAFYYEEDGVCYPRFQSKLNYKELFEYMQNWASKYFVPNPFAPSLKGNKPTCIYAYLAESIRNGNNDFDTALDSMFGVSLSSHDKVKVYLQNFTDITFDNHEMSFNERTNPLSSSLHPDEDTAANPKKYFDYFGIRNRLHTSNEIVSTSYLSALRSKPFLILAGISGTGKSRIVREFAYMTCPKELQDEDGTTPGNYCMIEVKPNWHDSTELLGYYSAMNHEYMFTKFDRFVVKAWLNKDVPFFVCLDEMNLAPVEQYFAEFLSVLETRSRDQEGNIASGALIESQYFDDSSKMAQELGLDKATDQWAIKVREHIVKDGLTLPPNLMIIGTVNMDDTTYQFSRKVIDRAMTIEMNGGELKNMFGNSKNLQYRADPIGLSAFKARYLNADEVIDVHTDFANRIKEVLPQKIEDLNKILEYTPFQVSYRVLNELVIYTGVLLDEAKIKAEEIDFEQIAAKAFDQITLMKILPRIEGDEDMFIRGGQNVLDHLQSLFASESASHKKLTEMKERLDRTGFTRFWP